MLQRRFGDAITPALHHRRPRLRHPRRPRRLRAPLVRRTLLAFPHRRRRLPRRALGELYWADEGSIGHNSTTSIFDRNGRLAATIDGSNYRPDQLVNLISRQLENHP